MIDTYSTTIADESATVAIITLNSTATVETKVS